MTNSREKVLGSVVVAVHVIVTTPPVVGLTWIEFKVKAETKGRRSASVLDNQGEDNP